MKPVSKFEEIMKKYSPQGRATNSDAPKTNDSKEVESGVTEGEDKPAVRVLGEVDKGVKDFFGLDEIDDKTKQQLRVITDFVANEGESPMVVLKEIENRIGIPYGMDRVKNVLNFINMLNRLNEDLEQIEAMEKGGKGSNGSKDSDNE